MDKYYKILHYLNKHAFRSQRVLAEEVGFSLGLVNAILKKLIQEGYLEKKDKLYLITETGLMYLEENRKKDQFDKLSIGKENNKIQTGVILAAGENKAFKCPTGLLKIQSVPLIEYIIRYLQQAGIEKIYVVTGAMEEQYVEYFKNRNIVLISNPRYKWSGTMESLARIEGIVKEDFLLIESNLIFEEAAIRSLLDTPAGSCLLLAAPSDSGDEAYVELNKDKTIFRISKDIRRLNHIDGEMVGISKIAYSLFLKMMEYFRSNTNPMLNYEYVIEDIARIYQIHGILINDMSWGLVENEELYYRAEQIVFPRILKKEKLRRENRAREILRKHLNLADGDIQKIQIGGGMTNTNFFVTFHDREYILRVPGAGTGQMIDRVSEQHNAALATALGINPRSIFFDAETGIKVTEYIEEAETLNGKTARLEANIRQTTKILKKLHQSDIRMYGSFSVSAEYEKYKQLIRQSGGKYYPGFHEVDQCFDVLMDRLDKIGLDKRPCHNDLVPENFVKSGSGIMYLIDWEYSGYYDPAWDLASHLLECEFSPAEEELFLKYYYSEGIDPKNQEKILIFKICQDLLWTAWTVLKEANGDDFGAYGKERMQRAKKLWEEYQEYYEGV